MEDDINYYRAEVRSRQPADAEHDPDRLRC